MIENCADARLAEDDNTGINLALLAALPPASKVLELGCATGRLARRYKTIYPSATWIGVDVNDDALNAARPYLDDVMKLDLDRDAITSAGSGFDLIVLGDVLEHLKRPENLLNELREICTPTGHLVCCIPNMSHISVIERLVRGDIMYDQIGLLDATHLRFLSPRSAFKMLLDAGWLPNAAGGYQGGHSNARFAQAIVDAAEALGIPKKSAELDVYTYQLIIDCSQRPRLSEAPPRGRVAVIVAAGEGAQLDLNVSRSPGLREIEAEFIVCRQSASAAAAYAEGLARSSAEWLLLCDEDVYFPRGSGFELLETLGRIAVADAATTLLGFTGLGVDEELQPFRAGLIVERRALQDSPATERAISIADFAVVLHRQSPLIIDPLLGRHLWATDLCLQSIYGPTARFPKVVRIPVLHNSVGDGSLPAAFAVSAQTLARKYPLLASISTLHADVHEDGTLWAPAYPHRVTA